MWKMVSVPATNRQGDLFRALRDQLHARDDASRQGETANLDPYLHQGGSTCRTVEQPDYSIGPPSPMRISIQYEF